MVTNQAGKIGFFQFLIMPDLQRTNLNNMFLKGVIMILFLSGAQRRAEGTVGEVESGIGWVLFSFFFTLFIQNKRVGSTLL